MNRRQKAETIYCRGGIPRLGVSSCAASVQTLTTFDACRVFNRMLGPPVIRRFDSAKMSGILTVI